MTEIETMQIKEIEDYLIERKRIVGTLEDIKRIIPERNAYSDNSIIFEDRYIRLPLPSANREWTYAIWDLTKSIVKRLEANGYRAYPVHENNPEFAKYQSIKYG